MKMIFISNNWADAHQQTRLNALQKLELSVTCLAVSRNYYPILSRHTPIFIGNMSHAYYGKRVGVYVRLFYQLYKNTGNNFLYVFGFDLMLICMIYRFVINKNIKIIYEIPDIREMFFAAKLSGLIIRWIESSVIPKIDLIVVTSPDFLSDYFCVLRKIAVSDTLIIENKIHPAEISNRSNLSFPVSPDKNKRIKIGFFGVLRCPISLHCLINLSEISYFEIILIGIFMPSTQHFEKLIEDQKHVHYLGPYKNPDDLHFMYSNVDLVWAVYPFSKNQLGNHLLARTNRFYESLYFIKPFIVQKGTADARRAALLGDIAFEIDLNNEIETINFLSKQITADRITALTKNLLTVPLNNCQITNEYNDLKKWLQLNI